MWFFLRLRNFCHATKPSYATEDRCPHKAIRATFPSSLHRHDTMLLQSDASSESVSIAPLLTARSTVFIGTN